MRKILFAVENYYPNLSGVPIVVKYLAEGLKNKYTVCVATRQVNKLSKYEMHNGIHIYRFDVKYNYLKRPKGEIKRYLNFLKDENFDIIILECAQCVTTDILLPHLSEISAVKILHSHGFSGLALKPFKIMGTLKNTIGNTLNYHIWKHYYDVVFPKYLPNIDKIVCLSNVDNDYKYLTRLGRDVVVISNAAEELFFIHGHNNTLSGYIPGLTSKYAICVAYYNDVKNQLGILTEFSRSKACREMSLVFIGTEKNNYYKKVEALLDKLKLNKPWLKVYLLTDVKRADIPGAVENATIYLCGSKREAYSISLIESMAVGTPFIGTNVGNSATLPGGVIISDISDMHIAIDELILDNDKLEQMSIAGRDYTIKNCRAQVAVEKLISVIEGAK